MKPFDIDNIITPESSGRELDEAVRIPDLAPQPKVGLQGALSIFFSPGIKKRCNELNVLVWCFTFFVLALLKQ